jgi:hypothetical protein
MLQQPALRPGGTFPRKRLVKARTKRFRGNVLDPSASAITTWARSGESDVQDEVSEPQVEYSAAGPVHDERQHDDGQNYDDHPEEEHDNARDGIPGNSSCSSHRHQLPIAARLIRRIFTEATGGMAAAAGARMRARGSGSDAPTRGRYLLVVALAQGEEEFIVTDRDVTAAEEKTLRRKAR